MGYRRVGNHILSLSTTTTTATPQAMPRLTHHLSSHILAKEHEEELERHLAEDEKNHTGRDPMQFENEEQEKESLEQYQMYQPMSPLQWEPSSDTLRELEHELHLLSSFPPSPSSSQSFSLAGVSLEYADPQERSEAQVRDGVLIFLYIFT